MPCWMLLGAPISMTTTSMNISAGNQLVCKRVRHFGLFEFLGHNYYNQCYFVKIPFWATAVITAISKD